MGTNYYLYEKPPCECCKRPYEGKHIGKSSGGWCFSLHVYPEQGIHDLDDWYDLLMTPGVTIKDEYGDQHTPEQMLERITKRSWGKSIKEQDFKKSPFYTSFNDFLQKNHATPGPSNLLRSKIDGSRCIKHGVGTWDCIIGDFS